MASTRPKTPSATSQTLVSAIRASEGLKAPTLKCLYGLFVHLSLTKSNPSSDSEHHSCRGLSMSSDDIQHICGILFRELDFKFRILFSALCDVSKSGEKTRALLQSDMPASVEQLTLLLRCCLTILTLVDCDVVLEKTRVLLRVLDRLIASVTSKNRKSSVTIEKVVSRESSFAVDAYTTSVSEDFRALLSILEPTDLFQPLLSAVLEVFADELLLNRLLREYFLRVASASCTSRSLFGCDFLCGDIGTVMEVISVHFILSFSEGGEEFENFCTRLSCKAGKDLRVSELGLNASLSLLLNPIILSAPKILQAHLTLLTSEAIGVSLSSGFMGTSYLTAFERSVVLYTGFMSSFLMDSHPIGWKASGSIPVLLDRRSESFSEWHIQESTRAKIDDIVTKADSLWDSEQFSVFDKAKPQLMADSITYMSESRVEECYKSDILSILNSIVLGAFSDSFTSDIVHQKLQRNPRHVYLLAAILKLMSTSMSAIVKCLRHKAKKYDSIVSIIGSFRHFNASLPHQKKLFGLMETYLTRHLDTKWMLLHFSGLLSLCFASGLDFLVDNCISTMVALMKLYVFEEGTIEALRPALVSDSESFSSQDMPRKFGEALVNHRLCRKIASRVQEIQTMCSSLEDPGAETSRNTCIMRLTSGCGPEIEEETEETCNGKVFLDCLLERSSKSECDGLADFIECKQGKDYASWLKDKETFRKWRSKKKAVLRWNKRKRTWRTMASINK